MLRFFKRLTWAGYQIADAIAPGASTTASGRRRTAGHPSASADLQRVDAANFITSRSEPEIPTLVWLAASTR